MSNMLSSIFSLITIRQQVLPYKFRVLLNNTGHENNLRGHQSQCECFAE